MGDSWSMMSPTSYAQATMSALRSGCRNRWRELMLNTRLGRLGMWIPELHIGEGLGDTDRGSLDRRVEHANVDDLVQTLGVEGISESQVSDLCKGIEGPPAGCQEQRWLQRTRRGG